MEEFLKIQDIADKIEAIRYALPTTESHLEDASLALLLAHSILQRWLDKEIQEERDSVD